MNDTAVDRISSHQPGCVWREKEDGQEARASCGSCDVASACGT